MRRDDRNMPESLLLYRYRNIPLELHNKLAVVRRRTSSFEDSCELQTMKKKQELLMTTGIAGDEKQPRWEEKQEEPLSDEEEESEAASTTTDGAQLLQEAGGGGGRRREEEEEEAPYYYPPSVAAEEEEEEEEQPNKRILLEALSPSGTRTILLLLYASCAASIWWRAASNPEDGRAAQTARLVARSNFSASYEAELRGLGGFGYGTATLSVRFSNFSSLLNGTIIDLGSLSYDVRVEASRSTSHRFSQVLSRQREATTMAEEGDFLRGRLASWYSNMEALSDRSRVNVLKVQIDYCLSTPPDNIDDVTTTTTTTTTTTEELFQCEPLVPVVAESIRTLPQQFVVEWSSNLYLRSRWSQVCRVLLVVLCFAIAAAFLPHQQNRADGERLRLLLMLTSLMLFVDPIQAFGSFTPVSAEMPPVVAWLSFASRRLSTAMLLASLMLMADDDGAAAQRLARRSAWKRARSYARLPGGFGGPGEEQEEFYSSSAYWALERWWLCIPFLYAGFALTTLSLRFPTLFGFGFLFSSKGEKKKKRAPTLAIDSWPDATLNLYVGMGLSLVASQLAFGVVLMWLLGRAGSRLEKCPYSTTRKYQLSYRFFLLQSLLVAGVGLSAYVELLSSLNRKYRRSIAIIVAHHTGTQRGKEDNAIHSSNSYSAALRDLASCLEAFISGDDYHDLSTAFFFTVYVVLLLYLRLPPPETPVLRSRGVTGKRSAALAYVRRYLPRAAISQMMREEVAHLANLSESLVSSQFVLTERADETRRRRQQTKNKKNFAGEVVLPYCFVVETARWCLSVAELAYYDEDDEEGPYYSEDGSRREKGRPPAKGGGPSSPSDKIATTLAVFRDVETETYCVVSRHPTEPWLVIAFRGSASVKHWYTNMDIRQTRLSLHDDFAEANNNMPPSPPVEPPVESWPPREEEEEEEEEEKHFEVDEEQGGPSLPRSWERPVLSISEMLGRGVVDGIVQGAAIVFGGVSRGLEVFGETAEAAGRASRVADFVPGVEKLVLPCVHRGFWTAYSGVRRDLHATVYRLLLESNYERVFCTGHSLGAALSTFAAADLAAHTLPRARADYAARGEKFSHDDHQSSCLRLTTVNFGSPRVGNHVWARIYETLCPDSWRVVTDGDIVTGVPKVFFQHCGTPVVVDGNGGATDFLIVDPSFIEKRLKLRTASQLSSHLVESYRRGISSAAGQGELTDPEPSPPDNSPAPPSNSLFERAMRRRRRRRRRRRDPWSLPPEPPDEALLATTESPARREQPEPGSEAATPFV